MPPKALYNDLDPWLSPWNTAKEQGLAQDVSCHFGLLFCVTLTLGKEP